MSAVPHSTVAPPRVMSKHILTWRRRICYLARLTYWTCRHRSLSRGLWVMAFDGRAWPRHDPEPEQ